MDWKVFAATFMTILLAELGDKTQMANFCMTAKTQSWFSVFIASVTAFALVTFVTVCLGRYVCKYIHPETVRYIAAVLFIGVGALMLLGKL